MSKTKRCRCVVGSSGNAQFPALAGGTAPCVDVCTSPTCADPSTLTLMAPVIYDQLGINLCSPVTLCGLCDYPTAHSASVQVIDVCFGEGTAITPLSGRPNCYEVTLANLTVTFAVRIFDCCGKQLTTLTASALYLPPDCADNHDEETNPDHVQFDIFAPYGVSYANGQLCQPLLNYIGFSSCNGGLLQGLNVTAFAKLLNLDVEDSSATIGLTVYVASLYYAQYQFGNISKADIPKVSLVPEDDTLCQNFVEGDLLNLAIKPLELGAPLFEENLKKDCSCHSSGCSGCNSAAETTDVSETMSSGSDEE